MSVDQALECLADGINPVRFCSSCGNSNPYVVCDCCLEQAAKDFEEMADTIKDMVAE